MDFNSKHLFVDKAQLRESNGIIKSTFVKILRILLGILKRSAYVMENLAHFKYEIYWLIVLHVRNKINRSYMS